MRGVWLIETAKRWAQDKDIFRLYNIDEIAIDSSGKFVAFSAMQPLESTDGYQSQVYVLNRDTGSVNAWTLQGQFSYAPKWSPDGRYLGFLTRRDHKLDQLYLLPTSGGEARVMTDFSNGISDFQWSPDGQWIVLCAPSGEPATSVTSATLVTPVTTEISATPSGHKPSARVIDTLKYKFNGRGFIYHRQRHLYLLQVDGGQLAPLTDGDADNRDPVWSPDGERIAFVSSRHAERDFDLGSDIFIIARNGGPIRQVTETRGSVESPKWSPDGHWIAYVGTDRLTSMPSHHRIWKVQPEGGRQILLSGNFDRTVVSGRGIVWSPEADRIWACFEDEGRVSLLQVNVATQQVEGDRDDLSQVGSFDLSPDGTWAARVRSTPTQPPEVFTGQLGQALVQSTHFHDQWCREVQFRAMEPFSAESSDGTLVPCWIMRPADFVEGMRYPGMLKIHGGPYAQFGYGFNHELQLWCASGYAVFFSNPRGSSGYSEEWARVLGRNRGITDYQDVMACTDSAVKQFPFIDPERLVVTGGSYGGYMTSWIIGHTHRFRVACSEAAPNNLYSMSGTSDLAGANHRLVYGFSAQENPAFYYERSPISYTYEMETPLLIIHGENDLRVSIEQAEQLFVALKLQRKEVKFVRFPGENHGLPRNGSPSHRIERFAYMLSWFETHLPSERTLRV